MFERFAPHMRDALFIAVEEAARRGDRRVSTDHLLVGILHDPSVAQNVGVGPDTARRVADQLDHEALVAIGIDDSAFGPLTSATPAANFPFTSGAKTVLKRMLARASGEKSPQIEPTHLLSAILELDAPDPGAELLAKLRANPHAQEKLDGS